MSRSTCNKVNIPQIVQKNLRGGVVYHDGQFDDSRLAVNLMQTAIEKGATVVNYARVTQSSEKSGRTDIRCRCQG
ncbi:MAG: FAD-dependent oxidoreductase [Marinilabiliales bacterium]|nr:FAD-dependent oxidoreductase [Marinilabiliales bacterium]